MKGAQKTLLLAALVGLSLFSCVPAKQYNLLKDNNTKCEEERSRFSRENDSLKIRVRELSSVRSVLEREKAALISDSTKRQIAFVALTQDYSKLQDRYNDLNLAHDALLKGTQSETKKLLAEIQKAQSLLMQREDSLRALEGQLNARSSKLSSAQTQMDSLLRNLNEKSATLIELQAMLAKKDSISNALRQKVKNALIGFDGKGLTITQKNGMVYVSMEDKLLFKSGSFEIDTRGADAIRGLAEVLAQNPDINIMVEGHTDDVPYQGRGELKDNWDLSVKRATTVVRLLTENKGINPTRITGAGRSQYLPMEAAKTPQARQKNRRTEIILTPNLDELMQIIEKN
ncbi:OmpA family protein [Acetobacteroides hydrogenigenes]|uniref:Chemotaxis protein MotB n=1 Tax=Acetobacteroides hydrogenigenes TaxID=979970 RepID=A0A4R2E4X4_9BACT|nr:OmpA family protein [Acetobacteroides hydrogenigenes]TCN61666.1 chemotaxis protein MotB [Acetobacteroides hydrogenigenes]